MRMWMVPAEYLCTTHLIGEHGELHKFLPSFRRGYSITKRVIPGQIQIEPMAMKTRHDELAAEMARRWPNRNDPHRSPWDADVQTLLAYLPDNERLAVVDKEQALMELHQRCPECRARTLKIKQAALRRTNEAKSCLGENQSILQ